MARLRKQHHRLYIAAKNKIGVVSAVEQKVKFYVGISLRNAFKRFVSKQANALQLIFNKKAGINCYTFTCLQSLTFSQ